MQSDDRSGAGCSADETAWRSAIERRGLLQQARALQADGQAAETSGEMQRRSVSCCLCRWDYSGTTQAKASESVWMSVLRRGARARIGGARGPTASTVALL